MVDFMNESELVFEENGYSVFEEVGTDGMSTFIVYDYLDNYIGEFEDFTLTDEDKKNFKDTYAYELFMDTIDEFEHWESDAKDDYLNDLDYKWLKSNTYYEPKSQLTLEEEKELVESLCKSDTIVFHQEDPTTVMLNPIYEGKGFDVYKGSMWSGDLSRKSIHELIKRHDKVVCLGHGTPSGLLSGVIGAEEAKLLKEKKVFALWCYAATYFKKHGFQGHGVLCSDNAPSEVWEAKAACNADVSKEWIYDNMLYWSECLEHVLELSWTNPEEACRLAQEEYSKAKADTPDEKKVVEFNTNTLQVV
jgi:hypothetical protein